MKKALIIGVAAWFAAAVSGFGADGAALWNTHCKKCHGADGSGNVPMGKKLKVKDYSKEAVSDDAIMKSMKEGVKEGGKPVMKAFSTLSEDEMKAITAHMKSLKK